MRPFGSRPVAPDRPASGEKPSASTQSRAGVDDAEHHRVRVRHLPRHGIGGGDDPRDRRAEGLRLTLHPLQFGPTGLEAVQLDLGLLHLAAGHGIGNGREPLVAALHKGDLLVQLVTLLLQVLEVGGADGRMHVGEDFACRDLRSERLEAALGRREAAAHCALHQAARIGVRHHAAGQLDRAGEGARNRDERAHTEDALGRLGHDHRTVGEALCHVARSGLRRVRPGVAWAGKREADRSKEEEPPRPPPRYDKRPCEKTDEEAHGNARERAGRCPADQRQRRRRGRPRIG